MTHTDVCSADIVDRKKVKLVSAALPADAENQSMAGLFKALGDPTRLRIVQALSLEELCVCDLVALMDVSISAISHQLRLLRTMKIVKNRKEGKMVYYSLDDEHINGLVLIAKEHVAEKQK